MAAVLCLTLLLAFLGPCPCLECTTHPLLQPLLKAKFKFLKCPLTSTLCTLSSLHASLSSPTQQHQCSQGRPLPDASSQLWWESDVQDKPSVLVCVCVCVHIQSCLTLCDPIDCSPPGSSFHGILQARYCSGLPFPPPGDILRPVIEPMSPALAGRFLYH